MDPAHKPVLGKRRPDPTRHGGKNWPPIAFSPKTAMIYIPATNICAAHPPERISNTRIHGSTNRCSSVLLLSGEFKPGNAHGQAGMK